MATIAGGGRSRLLAALFLMTAASWPSGRAWGAKAVSETARKIPMAYDVDVVVVGGTTGGVAAAVGAARAGAKVFLAAPRPYLGADMCGTLRLWLEPGEMPASTLARAVYTSAPAGQAVGKGLSFTYETDRKSSSKHGDTPGRTRLKDGRWRSAPTESVQYDGNVTITADLGRERALSRVHVLAYQRNDDFEVASFTVSLSADGRTWREAATARNEKLGKGGYEEDALDIPADVAGRARYVKLAIERGPRSGRILLGEVIVEPAEGEATEDAAAEGSEPPPAPPTPMQVKRALDKALLDAGVEFLFWSYATDVLRDGKGKLAGVVIANRSGRQAVRAKVVIDATDRAWLARVAGADFRPYPAGQQRFRRVVVGGEPRTGVNVRTLNFRFTSKGRSYPVHEYELALPMKDGSFPSFAEAEARARDLTFHPGQVDESETLFQVPPDPVKGRRSLAGEWPGADAVDLDAFRPAGVDRLYVVGGAADVPREAAAALVRPIELMDVGARIGRAAAEEAGRLPKPEGVRLAGRKAGRSARSEVRDAPQGIRFVDAGLPEVPAEARAVPVIGEYDVVVIGGGTGGAPAGIGAARAGARTLVVEYCHTLGGVGTLGLIGSYYHGYRGGFTAEHDRGVKEIGAAAHVVGKAEWWRRENRKAGADIWFGCLGCGALVENGGGAGKRVTGVVVATPEGRGVVLAKAVIDSTGNSDIAAAAGAECDYTGGEHVGVQGTGLPPRELGASYTNTDYMFADDTDVVDIWHLMVYAKNKFRGAYDLGQVVDTRERRRIVGDYTLTPLDMILGRTYPDTVVMSKSNFDSHGYTVHPVFVLKPPDRAGMTVYTPYRCLVPRGLDGMLVTGLGISAHRDAMPVVRMQPDIQNQGYAVGRAAAMAARTGRGVRGIDLKALQRHLVETKCVPGHVLTDRDPLPYPAARVREAVEKLGAGHRELAVILAHREQALPVLREAYRDWSAEKQLTYAHVLAMLGDATGVDTLVAKVEGVRQFDKGWNYKGMGQFGMSMSELDGYIVALGRTRDRKALGPVLTKLALLDAGKEFSHHRAVALALESLGDAAAAKPLAELLSKPGMTGHATTTLEEAERATGRSRTENRPRSNSLRELVLARALYRTGDHNGLGEKLLRKYARDLRGHYARHARAVLAER